MPAKLSFDLLVELGYMASGGFPQYLQRHRTAVRDALCVAIVAVLGATLSYQFDIFPNEAGGVHDHTIELDEALLFGGLVLSLGFAIFAARRYVEQKRETARRISAEQQVRHLAFQDTLTGLPNRRQFNEALTRAMESPPAAGLVHGVFLLDLNGFKQVNDIHGHAIGDELLIIVAERLLASLREGDLVARLGGDEFALLAPNLLGPEAATALARKIIQSLDAPVAIKKRQHRIAVAIGISLIPMDAQNRGEALRRADVALYRAKAERRSALRFFEEQMDRHNVEHDRMQQELRGALDRGEIRATFQPSFDLSSGLPVGFEVVPHWAHGKMRAIEPPRLIALAEDAGFIHELAEHLLRQGCEAAQLWPSHVRLSMDVYASQLKDKELTSRILQTLDKHSMAPSRLELEVTESTLVRDLASAEVILGPLHEAGVRITLDNFGTGYSTLYHLRKCKLDKIKIDPVFLTGPEDERTKARLVSALVGLGHGLGLTVAAEGIASAQERVKLAASGIQEAQAASLDSAVSAQDSVRLFDSVANATKKWAGGV